MAEYEKKVDEVRKLQAAIDEYNKNGGAEQLQIIRSELADLQLCKKELEARKEELDKEHLSTKEFLDKQEVRYIFLGSCWFTYFQLSAMLI